MGPVSHSSKASKSGGGHREGLAMHVCMYTCLYESIYAFIHYCF